MKMTGLLFFWLLASIAGKAVSLELVESEGVSSFQHASSTSEIICHPDGIHVLSSSRDQCVRLWEIKTGKLVRRFTSAGSGDMWGIRFIDGGRQFLAASSSNQVIRFEVETGKVLMTYRHDDDVYRIAVHSDGRHFVGAGGGKIAILWEIATGKKVRAFSGHERDVYTAILVNDGKELITGANDKSVRKWNLESGDCVKTLEAKPPYGSVYTLARSPGGGRFAMASDDDHVRVFESGSMEELWKVKLKKEAQVLAWSPDGELIGAASHDGHLYLLNAEDGTEVRKIKVAGDSHTPITFSLDGRTLISGGDRILHLHDVASGERIEPGMGLPSEAGRFTHLAIGLDGRMIYSARGSTLMVRDRVNGSQKKSWQENGSISAIALSDDGALLAVGGQGGEIVVHDTDTYAVVSRLSAGQQVSSIDFDSDGSRLVAGGAKGVARMWDLSSGKSLWTFKGHGDEVVAIEFSSDGEQVMTASTDETIRQWSTRNGSELVALKFGNGQPDSFLSVDEGRSLLVSAGKRSFFGRILPKMVRREVTDQEEVNRFLAQLGEDQFEKREEAMTALAEYGRDVIPYLEGVETDDPEVRARLIGVRMVMSGILSKGGLKAVGKFDDQAGNIAGDPRGQFWAARLGSEGASSIVFGSIDHDESTIKVSGIVENPQGPDTLVFSPDGSHLGSINSDGTYSIYRVKRD